MLEIRKSAVVLVWICVSLCGCVTAASSNAQPTGKQWTAIELEFRDQARRCGVSLEKPPPGEEGPAARLGSNGHELMLRGNVKDPKNKCMSDWARRRGLIAVFVRQPAAEADGPDHQAPSLRSFQEAARRCKLKLSSARYNGVEGKYDPKTRTLTLIGNQPKEHLNCMRNWATINGIIVIIANN